MLNVTDKGDCWRVVRFMHDAADNASAQWLITYPTFSNLPWNTQVQVSILRMCYDGEVVTDVGTRVSANTFWLTETKTVMGDYPRV